MITEIKVPSPGESITEVEISQWLVRDGSQVTKGQEIAEMESDKATLTIVADVSGKLSILAKEGQKVPVGSVAAVIDTDIIESDTSSQSQPQPQPQNPDSGNLKISAVAKEMMKEQQLSVDELISGLKRIGRKEVEEVIKLRQNENIPDPQSVTHSREIVKERMTMLRRKLSERLVSVKNETAMLTTFNEVDMSAVMELRTRFQQKFTEKHGLKLGFMAFFTKAVAIATQYYPTLNSMIDGEEILSPQYVDVGIAVQTPKGLMVPVVRNAESKSIPQIEIEIRDLAEKARTKKISIEELSGGTFTITNGGVFGSLLSTPILNPPQSAILGMHNIVERPVAIKGRVEIRPMMYIALSYDHRVIDGKDSVGFLVKVKEMIENPGRMFAQGKDPVELLLEI
jgi:2-oxoglutarate dehydrogenase E2 component (dihydrolipoamide succinyltransferase)